MLKIFFVSITGALSCLLVLLVLDAVFYANAANFETSLWDLNSLKLTSAPDLPLEYDLTFQPLNGSDDFPLIMDRYGRVISSDDELKLTKEEINEFAF
ncbi:MAG: hypothetical protein UT55_C0039G0011 [Candidatus Peregrinibacteria bacterium GW2011_GWE2_39_6]|nr:MAG: hypothetical protein UT36_C0001G0201 [Candidatus Peregrinibacteria bacterium GW2011_GWF2_39_17]KKR25540.1 MAG: hypothetical protein UT55_C0039G0011 [Candidatus Peregrinibacteria bacterium GW2011_GWE2_39_6]HCW32639.1 hypothetical protein [Candidatus Peregrinibacteria bacterium]